MKKDIYIFNEGDLRRKNSSLVLNSGETKKYVPIESISNIWVFGEVTINKSLLELLSEKEICIHFFNYYGYYVGTYYPREHLNSGYVLVNQVTHYTDFNKRLALAKKIIYTGVRNILINLRYYKSRGADLETEINNIQGYIDKMLEVGTIESLMAYEGNIRNTYYQSFNKIIKNNDFEFTQRSRRPPKDSINALISFGNSLMYTTVLGEIYKTHLDPRIGYLHVTNDRRFSLNLDIAEIFKPIIVDRVIFSLLNKGIITMKDFNKDLNSILLTENGRKKFIEEYNSKLESVIKHPKLDINVSYRRLIRLEIYKIQKHVTEDETYEGFISRW